MLFWTITKKKHFFSQSTSVHSASEALATMRYINWYFTYLLKDGTYARISPGEGARFPSSNRVGLLALSFQAGVGWWHKTDRFFFPPQQSAIPRLTGQFCFSFRSKTSEIVDHDQAGRPSIIRRRPDNSEIR